jgi:hypothetical protein
LATVEEIAEALGVEGSMLLKASTVETEKRSAGRSD